MENEASGTSGSTRKESLDCEGFQSVSLQLKRQATGHDRISGLPDRVLHHMLSFLETKYAVRTSILSTRWKNIWVSVPTLDFRGILLPHSIAFVKRVLSLRDSSDIEKFRFDAIFRDIESSFCVNGWIRNAIQHNVVELDLCVEICKKDQTFELPESLFTCKTLKVLKLRSNFITNGPASGCFPSVKLLHVILDYPKDNSILQLFWSCPVLEDLAIEGSREYGKVMNFNIHAPELKRLKIKLGSDDFSKDGDYFFISAPKLETLDCQEQGLSNYVLKNANPLFKASIILHDHDANESTLSFADRATALMAGISNVKHLDLSAHLLEVCFLPAAFENLNHLGLVLHQCNDWRLLMEMLNRSPNLEHLILVHEQGSSCDEDYGHPKHVWNPPESAPICLSTSLKTITMCKFSGRKDETKAAKYLLNNGEVLNEMTIDTYVARLRKVKNIYKKLCGFQRSSKTCRVKFD